MQILRWDPAQDRRGGTDSGPSLQARTVRASGSKPDIQPRRNVDITPRCRRSA